MAFVEFRSLNSKADHLVKLGFSIFNSRGYGRKPSSLPESPLSLP